MKKIFIVNIFCALLFFMSCQEGSSFSNEAGVNKSKATNITSDSNEQKKENGKTFSNENIKRKDSITTDSLLLINANDKFNSKSRFKVLTSLEELGLKSDVAILKQEEFYPSESSDAIGVKTGENSFGYKFDNLGNKNYEAYLDDQGIIKDYSKYYFRNDGYASSKETYNTDGKMIKSYVYYYDSLDRITKFYIKDYNEDVEYYSTAQYNVNGNMTLLGIQTSNGTTIQTSEYTYLNGLKTSMIIKDNFGSQTAKCEYSYNQFGDIIKEVYYTGNNLPFSEYNCDYVYDKYNNWIVKKYYLKKIYMVTKDNENKKNGLQTITMRTLTYK